MLCPTERLTFLSLKVGELIRDVSLLEANRVVVLSRLVCASLTEDRYGVVQRDIPCVLEALLVFLMALEDAQKEIASPDDAEDAARAADVYSGPVDGMNILSLRRFCR